MEDHFPRKLAAILYADVAGYGRLTGEDEEGTHRILRSYLGRISSTVKNHSGRVVHYAGDAVLADFGTVVDALSCAARIQCELWKLNSELPEERKVQFRIGVNLGDVIEDRGDIFGDGVNVAARLESLSEPGGICISESVQTAVGNKLPFDYEFLGEQKVKNIATPVKAYRARLKPGAALPELTRAPGKKKRDRKLFVAAVVAVILLAGVVLTWLRPWEAQKEPASIERMALPLPDKPSIVVLPFTNMSDDPEQEYFVDGMTEDLITDLSKVSGLFVIARNSAFTYKDKSPGARQISHELGVKYVLEGSVRRAGEQVRINAQLIDASTGGNVWAERYDGSLAEVFELQDRVAEQIVAALAVTLTTEEAAQHVDQKTSNPQAYDAFLQGWAHYLLNTPDSLAHAVPYFEKAVRLDPAYSHAHAALAAVYWESWNNGWVQRLGVSFIQASRLAKAHLREAMRRPTALAHWVASNILASSEEDYERAVEEAERAIALEPNNATGHAALSTALILAGRPAKAAESIDTAIRLDPLYPSYLVILGRAQFALELFEEAASTFERAVKRNSENEQAWVYLAATYGHLGRTEDGTAALENYNELRIQHGLAEFMLEHVDYWRFGSGVDRERVRAGLSKVPDPEWRTLITRGPEGYEVRGCPKIDTATAKAFHDRGARFADLQYWTQDWIAGHVPGAVRLEPGRVSRGRLREIVGDREEQEVVFYGSDTASSAQACAKAIAWGYKQIFQFSEGMVGWRAAGYPIEKGE